MTLDKEEFPRFMKRLRKLVFQTQTAFDVPIKLKYYACGEYGSKGARPHYHAIIFNVPDDEMFFKAWTVDGSPIGIVHVGQVSGDSIAYTAGYVNKRQLTAPRRNDDRVPEFSLMSKGLGSNYVTPAIASFHTTDLNRNYITKDGGDTIAMPRYYRERIFSDDERSYQQGLAQVALGKYNSEQYAYFLSHYGNIEGYSYDEYLEQKRLGAVDAFYNNQKNRDL